MDSDGDMHDATETEYDSEDGSGMNSYADEDDEAAYDFIVDDSDDSEDAIAHRPQNNYTVLSEADIERRQDEAITSVSTVLSVSRASACILLRHYNWSVSEVHDEWFADEENVRKVVGLLERPVGMPNPTELTCGICFETYPRYVMSAAACCHHFCASCWRGYIGTSVNDGPGCLMLRCPDPSCGAAIGQDMVNALATNEDKAKYSRYFLRSYIEDNKKGLINALQSVVPNSEHRFCVMHLYKNMNKEFKGVTLRNILWKAARSTTLWEFNKHMDSLKEVSPKCYQWLLERPRHQWSRSAFRTTPCSDMFVNNHCEVFNASIRPYRDQPIITMLRGIHMAIMKRIQMRRDKMKNREKLLCPSVEEKIQKALHFAASCEVVWSGSKKYFVKVSEGGQELVVDLELKSCSCNKWQLTGVPCYHACAVISLVNDGWDLHTAHWYFTENYVKTKWCPSPGCDYAVDFIIGSASYDVSCNCSYGFCWNCTEEAHRPVDCEMVAKWILKNSAESENMNWILANSKPCPKCKRPIEKNQGCMHMTCTPPCKFEFCWLCLGVWSEHGERTGGFYACNRYEAAKQEGAFDEEEKRREMAKNSLERYTHYYERWATNQSSRQKALADLHSMQSEKLDKLSNSQKQPEAQLKFIIDAWSQIVECRRVLKWTYAYGYYLPELEKTKRQFFEYIQGEAESGLERLHQCAEKELEVYLNAENPVVGFNDFRTKLAGLTSVTRNYFENLVRALETGLQDVTRTPEATDNKNLNSKNMRSKTTKSKGGGTSSRSGAPTSDLCGYWSCEHCAYPNTRSVSRCQMCEHQA